MKAHFEISKLTENKDKTFLRFSLRLFLGSLCVLHIKGVRIRAGRLLPPSYAQKSRHVALTPIHESFLTELARFIDTRIAPFYPKHCSPGLGQGINVDCCRPSPEDELEFAAQVLSYEFEVKE